MLRCKIELIPFGDFTRNKKLSTLLISNDGTGDAEIGNYDVHLMEIGKTLRGRVENHPRLQHGPAFLVAKAIEACLKGENSEPEIDNA